MNARVFICYASPDGPSALALTVEMETAGVTCWIAPRDIPAAALYSTSIVRAIRDCSAMVVLLSASTGKSPHVLRELECAASQGTPLIAVNLDGSEPSETLAYYLAPHQWLRVETQQNGWREVIETARQIVHATDVRPKVRWPRLILASWRAEVTPRTVLKTGVVMLVASPFALWTSVSQSDSDTSSLGLILMARASLLLCVGALLPIALALSQRIREERNARAGLQRTRTDHYRSAAARVALVGMALWYLSVMDQNQQSVSTLPGDVTAIDMHPVFFAVMAARERGFDFDWLWWAAGTVSASAFVVAVSLLAVEWERTVRGVKGTAAASILASAFLLPSRALPNVSTIYWLTGAAFVLFAFLLERRGLKRRDRRRARAEAPPSTAAADLHLGSHNRSL